MKIAALDIGGTSIKSGIWEEGNLYGLKEHETRAKAGGAAVMEQAKQALGECGKFDAIGISTAGQVDPWEGYIRFANDNIPGYTGMRIREIMEKEFGVPVAVENDVNAAALGEGRFGAGLGEPDFLCATYGTGVGGAIVVGGEVYRGSACSAGEFGGILIHPQDRVPGDPFSGCYERYASTTALVNKAKELDPGLDNGRKIFARIDEPKVRAVVEQWAEEIAYGLVTLVCIFNPSCIILGGGVMAQPYILERVEEKVRKQIMPSFGGLKLRQATLGNQAGLLGAAWLGSQKLQGFSQKGRNEP